MKKERNNINKTGVSFFMFFLRIDEVKMDDHEQNIIFLN